MCTFYLLPTSFCLLFLRDAREWLSICETVSVSGHGLCVYVCMHVFVCAILYETVLAFDLTLSE